MIRKAIKIIKDSEKKLHEFDDEYNKMASRNESKSNNIRKKMDEKSARFAKEKSDRSKQFDIIRNKLQ